MFALADIKYDIRIPRFFVGFGKKIYHRDNKIDDTAVVVATAGTDVQLQ